MFILFLILLNALFVAAETSLARIRRGDVAAYFRPEKSLYQCPADRHHLHIVAAGLVRGTIAGELDDGSARREAMDDGNSPGSADPGVSLAAGYRVVPQSALRVPDFTFTSCCHRGTTAPHHCLGQGGKGHRTSGDPVACHVSAYLSVGWRRVLDCKGYRQAFWRKVYAGGRHFPK